jgi:DNA modification methylase
VNPVLVDPDGRIIAGHARVLAALQLGMTHVLIIVLKHLTPAQKRAFMIADNKLSLNAGWNLEMLRLELQDLAEQEIALPLTGFGEEELQELLAEHSGPGLLDADDAPALEQSVVTRLGDMWELGRNKLLCADSTDPENLKRILSGDTCDLVFTDLPYNVDYTGKNGRGQKILNDDLGDEFDGFVEAACRSIVGVSAGPIYICMSSSELHTLYSNFKKAGGVWSTTIIWSKHLFTLGRSDYQRQYEPILYGWPQGSKHYWCGARDQGDVWYLEKPRANDLHPTMKPVALVERALENSSRPSSVVLDPFAGSGTTAIACERTGRKARLVELDPRYADVAVRRWQSYTGQRARRQSDGALFEDLALGTQRAHQTSANSGFNRIVTRPLTRSL